MPEMSQLLKDVKAYLTLVDYRDRCIHNYFIETKYIHTESVQPLLEDSLLSVYHLPRSTKRLVREALGLGDEKKGDQGHKGLYTYIRTCEHPGCAEGIRDQWEDQVTVKLENQEDWETQKQVLSKNHYPEFFYQMLHWFAGEEPPPPNGRCPSVMHFIQRLRELGYHELWGLGEELEVLEKAAAQGNPTLQDAKLFHACVRAFVAFPFLPEDGLDGILRSKLNNNNWSWAYFQLGNSTQLLSFPIMDMGSLQGFLYIRPEYNELESIREKVEPIISRFPPIIRAAREADFLHIPLKPGDDPIEHLVRHLPVVQSWGRIEVVRSGQALYAYGYCLLGEESRLQRWQKKAPHASNSSFTYKLQLSEILDPRILPGCTDEDRARFGSLELHFFTHEEEKDKDISWPERRHQIIRLLSATLERHRTHRHALRASVSAIMSRNIAHNFHSHITPRTTVEKVVSRLQAFGLCPQGLKDCLDVISSLKGRLDKYAQQKADFLAEVTTEPIMTTKPALFYRDVILPLVHNPLFMDNIAANEDICYKNGKENRLKIRVQINNRDLKTYYKCSDCCYKCRYPTYSLCCPQHPTKELQASIENGDDDVEVGLPGPLGEFAFYGFLENFIRNAAKHNKESLKTKDLEVHICIEDQQNPDFYVVKVWDNVSKPNGLVKRLKDYIQSDLVDSEGRLKREAWGIAEMKTCATLLRGSTDFINMAQYLQVMEENDRLVYKFYLMKSKKLCAVLPKWSNNEKREQLRKEGIWIFKQLKELEDTLSSSESAASFQFALFDCSGNNEETEKIVQGLHSLLARLPFRVLVLTGNRNDVQLPKGVQPVPETWDSVRLEQKESYEILQWLWQQWLKRWLPNPKDCAVLEVYLDQTEDESPCKEWIEHAQGFNKQTGLVKVRVWAKKEDQIRGEQNGQKCNKCNERHIFFDRHGGAIRHSRFEGDFLDEHSYIFLDKLNPDFIKIFQPVFKTNGWTLPFELAESGLLRILVVDERMAEMCLNTVDDIDARSIAYMLTRCLGVSPTIWHIAFGAKVYICTHFGFCKEPQPLYEGYLQKVNKSYERYQQFVPPYLSVQVGDQQIICKYWYLDDGNIKYGVLKDIDMLIIHQGVIDGIRGVTVKGFLDKVREHIPFVVVESGRGIPPNLPPDAKFLPFSILAHLIGGKRVAKYSLTQVVMGLTRRRHA